MNEFLVVAVYQSGASRLSYGFVSADASDEAISTFLKQRKQEGLRMTGEAIALKGIVSCVQTVDLRVLHHTHPRGGA